MSKLWYLKLSEFLRRNGYEISDVEPYVFRRVNNDMVYLFIVIDDMLIIASGTELERIHKI
jgi:hypothetical protein